MKTSTKASIATFLLLCARPLSAQVQIGTSGYIQNFNALGESLPENWSLRTGATTTSLGISGASFSSTPATWSDTSAGFKNFASLADAGDRALGIRQTGSFGDPGAAFVFNFSSAGTTLGTIELDLLMLSVQGRSTKWTIDYGIGSAPTSFTLLDTWTDPGVFGSTRITISEDLAELSNESSVWLRIVALGGSTGGGSRDSIAIDNFAITAIPEPATYVRWCGATVLLIAFIRRVRQRRGAGSSLA